jgi:hypothetical protein
LVVQAVQLLVLSQNRPLQQLLVLFAPAHPDPLPAHA